MLSGSCSYQNPLILFGFICVPLNVYLAMDALRYEFPAQGVIVVGLESEKFTPVITKDERL